MSARSQNAVMTVEGEIVREPEFKYTPSGSALLTGTVKTVFFDRDDKEVGSEWTDFEIWNAPAEAWRTSGLLNQGEVVELQNFKKKTSSWNDRETGAKRTRVTAVWQDYGSRIVKVLDPFGGLQARPMDQETGAPADAPRQTPRPAPRAVLAAPAASAPTTAVEDDEDLPF